MHFDDHFDADDFDLGQSALSLYDRLIAYPPAKAKMHAWYLLPHALECVWRGDLPLRDLFDYTAWLSSMTANWMVEWHDDGPYFPYFPYAEEAMVKLFDPLEVVDLLGVQWD